MADGKTAAATTAVFILDGENPKFRQEREPRLSKTGQFAELYLLSWDEERFCRGGHVVPQRSVEVAHILVRVTGCKDTPVELTEAGRDEIIIVECYR